MFQGYGMTESSAVLTALGPRRASRRRAAAAFGRAAAAGCRAVDPGSDGTSLAPGETGEVCARAGNFMREYWKQPEATADAFRGGWYHSGDAGYLDADGYLFLVDRVKDMIVTGGENVYSVEVENAIASHPAVAQVAVIGIPSEKWGEAVHAIVVVRRGREPSTEAEIIEHTREWIAGYKVPKSVEIRSRAAAAVGRDEGAEARAAGAVLGGPRPRGEFERSRRFGAASRVRGQFRATGADESRGTTKEAPCGESSSGGPDRR